MSTTYHELTSTINDEVSGVPTSGTYVPRIWFRRWSPSDSTLWASTPGTLASGNGNSGTWNFTIDYSAIGITPAVGDIIQYYVVAQDLASNPVNPNIGFHPSYWNNMAAHANNDVTNQTSAMPTPSSFTISDPFGTGTIASISSV